MALNPFYRLWICSAHCQIKVMMQPSTSNTVRTSNWGLIKQKDHLTVYPKGYYQVSLIILCAKLGGATIKLSTFSAISVVFPWWDGFSAAANLWEVLVSASCWCRHARAISTCAPVSGNSTHVSLLHHLHCTFQLHHMHVRDTLDP